jgi:protein TonB
MFEQTFVQTQAATRRPWTVAMSLSLQTAVVGVILLIPLLHPAVLKIPELPKAHLINTWANLAPRPQQVATSAPVAPSAIHIPRIYNPSLRPLPPPPAGRNIGVPTDVASGWQGGEPALVSTAGLPVGVALPPSVPVPAPAPAAIKPAGPFHISSGVEAAKLTYNPKPVYPQIAITARVQGTVQLEAVIATDGRVRNLRVLSGSPLLVRAALDAVQQWKYQPTLLNGAPVEVVTEIEVNFTLSR